MSFEVEVPETPTEATESTAHLTTNLITYRTYGAFDSEGKAKGVKSKDKDGNLEFNSTVSVLSETQTKKNWDEADKRGATVLNENAFKFYTLTDVAGFSDLVPVETQRLYIIQKGIDALQTAAANRIQTELAEKNSKDEPDQFVYNGDTVDLREAINTPPQRKSMTDEEKFMKAMSVLSPDKAIAMLENFKRMLQAQSSAE
jgi:hypothetical protein